MIVHLMMDEKFTSDFIQQVEENFNKNKEHRFMIITTHDPLKYELSASSDCIYYIRKNYKSLKVLISYMRTADRVIIHGLFNPWLVYLIFLFNVAPKSIWCIWGGDLYSFPMEKPLFKAVKKRIIHRFMGCCSQIPGDCALAREWYGFQGKHYVCASIIEVINKDCPRQLYPETYNIIIGNSADAENRHLYILEKLKRLSLDNVRLILPLSYGNQQYADEIEHAYKEAFGNQVICLREFMNKANYYQLLNEIDVALYAHRRQQAVGNISYLLQTGTKVYLEQYVTTYSWLKDNGICIFDIETLDQSVFDPLSAHDACENSRIMKSMTSKETVLSQYRNLFEN